MPMLPPDYKRPSSSKYVKLEQGNNVLRILSPPVFGWEGWIGEKGKDRKPVRKHNERDFKPGEVLKDRENRIKFFWAMPVWNYAAGAVHVWQITQVGIMDSITALDNNPKWGDARTFDLCIVKSGEGLETEYQVMPEPKTELSGEVAKAWAEVSQTFDINRLFDNGDPFGSDNPDSDIPF